MLSQWLWLEDRLLLSTRAFVLFPPNFLLSYLFILQEELYINALKSLKQSSWYFDWKYITLTSWFGKSFHLYNVDLSNKKLNIFLHLLKFYLVSLSRVHSFLNKSCFSPGNFVPMYMLIFDSVVKKSSFPLCFLQRKATDFSMVAFFQLVRRCPFEDVQKELPSSWNRWVSNESKQKFF